MATKPTMGQRWPTGQEATRRRTIEQAADAHELLREARDNLYDNPGLAALQISDAQQILIRIQLWMTQAKQGAEPPAQGEP